MSIQGSVVTYFPNSGNNVITLPKKGLTIVGLSVSNGALSIPITPGRNAVFLGNPVGTYVFIPVQFQSESGEINVNTITGDTAIIVFYGTPMPNTPQLSQYSGILIGNQSISVPASITTNTLYSANFTANFPSSANNIVGYEYSGGDLPAGVTGLGFYWLSFVVSTGQSINLPIPAQGGYIPDYPNNTGILPLNIPVTQVVNASLSGYFANANTSATNVTVSVVFYYA